MVGSSGDLRAASAAAVAGAAAGPRAEPAYGSQRGRSSVCRGANGAP